VVAYPPFSAQWSANPQFMTDERFSQYGRLEPSGKADFAFVQHMIFQLADIGTSIPTCILVFKKCRETPEDVLFIDASQHFEKVKTKTCSGMRTSQRLLTPTATALKNPDTAKKLL
jgi:type I restriction enzyme M protein